ncbi:alpha/beta fold hydrolase [uncultured Tessaracoccus sp.]|uniref:alpha/beta fold hydrolase n=1 Tax=uncultured Tessaracoccus sp. TaxID=905023 RepID=UPI0026023F7C|nr:alpha/beta fold hydrolase [uncultured Tessaracoccus sp.]
MTLYSRTVGDGPIDVVFMHGLFGQGKNWFTVARALEAVATSHLLDMPNHGHSPWTVEFDYDEMADIVGDWILDNFDHPVVVVGHSMGGKVAMRFALQRPEAVAGLVVVDISPARNDSALNFTSLVAGLKSLPLNDVVNRGWADRVLAERIPNDDIRRFLLQNLQHKDGAWSWLPNLDLLGDNLHAIAGWKPAAGWSYEGPTLWVAGGRSDYIKESHQAVMRELFPAVRMMTVKQAGHWVHADDPDTFVQTLRLFLGELSG